MKKYIVILLAILATGFFLHNLGIHKKLEEAAVRDELPAQSMQMDLNYGRIPLHFEPNQGQIADPVKFLARGPGYQLLLKPTEAELRLRKATPEMRDAKAAPESETDISESRMTPNESRTTLRMHLIDANPNPKIEALNMLPGKTNYFKGNDPSMWRTNVPNYEKVISYDVYPGIDLVYYGNPQQLEYDFVVKPGVDPDQITMAFEGVNHLELDGDGNLGMDVEGGSVTLQSPVIYQEVNGSKTPIDGRFIQRGDRSIGFEVETYDPSHTLVIDPVLVYSTYLGGSKSEGSGNFIGIAVDALGNAYVIGTTESTDFPTLNPFQDTHGGSSLDAFVTKLNADGSGLVYSTYLGGSNWEFGNSIAVDASGNAYVTGKTFSLDFPTANPFQASCSDCDLNYSDAFVSKLNSTGSSLIFSTYLGGGHVDAGNSIAIDTSGNCYVTGIASAFRDDFPTVNPFQSAPGGGAEDAFVTKFDPVGSPIYSTYLGGRYNDPGNGITVDDAGHAYVTGTTGSDDFPIVNPFQSSKGGGSGNNDAYVAKLNPGGTNLVYSTYLGGIGNDQGFGIAVDNSGNAYVTGETSSDDFPIANALHSTRSKPTSDAFVTKLNPDGAVLYSTYLNYTLRGNGIAVNTAGNAYIVGETNSPVFLTVDPIQGTLAGLWDAFIATLDPMGSQILFSTYLGGSGGDEGIGIAVFPTASGVDIYVAGETGSADFPLINPAQEEYAGSGDVFVAKIGLDKTYHLIYDEVTMGSPPVFSRGPTTPQQILPQYLLKSARDTVHFEFVGRSTDSQVGLRVVNTRVHGINNPPLNLDLKIIDPDESEITPFTIPLMGTGNAGEQFGVSKNGTYTIKVFAEESSPGPFPAPFQIHLAGNVGHPRRLVNGQPEVARATRQDILFNHPAPRPQGIYGKEDNTAQTALFKFTNTAELSEFANAVIIPHTTSGVSINSTIVRAPDPDHPLDITTPTARTPGCGAPWSGMVIDFTQVPDPKEAGDNTTLDGSVCAVIGAVIGEYEGSTVDLPLPLVDRFTGQPAGVSSSLIFDMGSGQEIVDGEGDDLRVHAAAGSYTVAVGNTPYAGTFRPIGSIVSGTQSFDLAGTGLTSARYVLVTASPNLTLDAVHGLNVFVDNVIQDQVTGSDILVGKINSATMTARRAKAPETDIDPILDLIAPDGSRFGQDDGGFGDPTSQAFTDAALRSINLPQEGFYRFLTRGPYDGIEADQSFGAFFVRLESDGIFDRTLITVSEQNEEATAPQKTGSFNRRRQRDSYLFQRKPGESIIIVVNALSESLDPMVELYDPEGFLIGSNDNFEGRDRNAVLPITLPGNNYVGAAFPDLIQTYRIVVSAVDPKRGDSPNDWVGLAEGKAYFRGTANGEYELKVFTGLLTNIEQGQTANVPFKFALRQNYPNPFNPETRIEYRVGSTEYVTLKVYDASGREVTTLVDEYKPAGSYEIEFDASSLSSGTYFYILRAGAFLQTKKFILIE